MAAGAPSHGTTGTMDNPALREVKSLNLLQITKDNIQ